MLQLSSSKFLTLASAMLFLTLSHPSTSVARGPDPEAEDPDAVTALVRTIQQNKTAGHLTTPDQLQDDPQCVAPTGSAATAAEPWLEGREDCAANQNYFEAAFSKYPETFRETRETSSTEVPRSCLSYMMRTTFDSKRDVRHTHFASCRTPTGMPYHGDFKACTTEQYVNIVYNTFGDVATCMGLPQKDLIPQLYNESSFQMNALGSRYDAGIGQITGPAIEAANGFFAATKNQITSDSSGACRRIAPYVQALSPVSSSVEHRCELLEPPANPLENLIYTGIVYQLDLARAKDAFSAYDIAGLLARAGLPNADLGKLEEMIALLGYNSGAGKAPEYLLEYLKLRTSMIRRYGAKKLKNSDFDFRIKRKPFSYVNCTFPEYLERFQVAGTHGYLSVLSDHAQKLNKLFSEGTCASGTYLSL